MEEHCLVNYMKYVIVASSNL